MDKTPLQDAAVLGEKANVTHEDVVQLGRLTDEEIILEKKLVRKIDTMIMPLVVLIYLMNYIDRYAGAFLFLFPCNLPFGSLSQKQLPSSSSSRS